MANGDHFYTTSRPERDNAFAFLGYLEEGVACYVYGTSVPGTTPLLRLYKPSSGDHFYTTSPAEATNAVSKHGYQSEGIACYVFESPSQATVPLFRLYNKNNDDHFYTIYQSEANIAVSSFGYVSEGFACYVFDSASQDTIPFYRLLKSSQSVNANASQSPWAIILCKFKNYQVEPPNPPGTLLLRAGCERFFTLPNGTFNAVRYFSDMSHGKLDLSGSQVLGWYTIDANITGRLQDNTPVLDKTQNEIVELAIKAAKDAGVAMNKFPHVVVIMNEATGWAQGAPGWVAADWRRIDGRNPDGTLGTRGTGGGNGIEAFGQEMGHAYGLDHSRQNGSNVDYMDPWDVMSTLNAFSDADIDYGARGPGLNAWHMRSRDWLDESRVWKPPANTDFTQIIQLRPLHQRNLPGYLAAELPGIGDHSPYLVEFRVPELWDTGIPEATILVHRFSGAEEAGQTYTAALLGQPLGTHSYIMNGSGGQFSFSEGDILKMGFGPFSRMKVLSIDLPNRIATVQLCFSHSATVIPTVKIQNVIGISNCTPALVEKTVGKFRYKISNLQCSQSYEIEWSVNGASGVAGETYDQNYFSIDIPATSVSVTVSVKLKFDDKSTASDSFTFNPLSADEARLREFLCNLKNERLKPIPWWEWDPAKFRIILSNYSRSELIQLEQNMENILNKIKQVVGISKK